MKEARLLNHVTLFLVIPATPQPARPKKFNFFRSTRPSSCIAEENILVGDSVKDNSDHRIPVNDLEDRSMSKEKDGMECRIQWNITFVKSRVKSFPIFWLQGTQKDSRCPYLKYKLAKRRKRESDLEKWTAQAIGRLLSPKPRMLSSSGDQITAPQC